MPLYHELQVLLNFLWIFNDKFRLDWKSELEIVKSDKSVKTYQFNTSAKKKKLRGASKKVTFGFEPRLLLTFLDNILVWMWPSFVIILSKGFQCSLSCETFGKFLFLRFLRGCLQKDTQLESGWSLFQKSKLLRIQLICAVTIDKVKTGFRT